MNEHGLTKANLVATLPVALQKDPSAVALAEAMAELLAQRPKEIERLLIYPAIDRLDEQLLDILAYDFKVDWWDADYSLEEKRRTLKDSWRVHKMMGTKAAVETAISAIYPRTKVLEWFEYGGEPYHFRLDINVTGDDINSEKQRRVLERMNYYKSLRSRNDGVMYFMLPDKAWAAAGGGFVGSRRTIRTDISSPPLKRPGGTALTLAGCATGGMCFQMSAAPKVPPLERPKGVTRPAVGAALFGSFQRTSAAVHTGGKIWPPKGRGGTCCSCGVFHSYQRVWVSVRSPAIL